MVVKELFKLPEEWKSPKASPKARLLMNTNYDPNPISQRTSAADSVAEDNEVR